MLNGQCSLKESFRPMFNLGLESAQKILKERLIEIRIKRLTREAWRLQKNDPIAVGLKEKIKTSGRQLNVFFIYTGKELPDFTTVKDKVAVALKKLADKTDENISSHP